MNTLTFIFAMLGNLKIAFTLAAVLGSALYLILLGIAAMNDDVYSRREETRGLPKLLKFKWKFATFLISTVLIASIPDANDLWRVRVSMIKLELASPDNLSKGVETIERIGQKLECKYLGCAEAVKEVKK